MPAPDSPIAMVTVCSPLPAEAVPRALDRIRAMADPSGALAGPAARAALGRLSGDLGVHFVSLHALPPGDSGATDGRLVLELTADGEVDAALEALAANLGDDLAAVFAFASNRGSGGLAAYLKAHVVKVGHGLTGQAGLPFAGTPGMTVGRIHREAALAAAVAARLGEQRCGLAALDRLGDVRERVRTDPALAWALQPGEALRVPSPKTGPGLLVALVVSFARAWLWPLAIPLVVVLAFGVVHGWRVAEALPAASDAGAGPLPWLWIKGLWAAVLWVLAVLCAFAVPFLLVAAAIYVGLRRAEASDPVDGRAPDRAVLREIVRGENRTAQNHMISVTTVKPGLVRWVTLRLAFWLIGALAGLSFKPGHLGQIGTIHFARWVQLPGTRSLIFFSNFGGSWESYLEDFITKAHEGLTAVWSNTRGFPRTENLFLKGATDGERFKRFARHSMPPTPFWFTAYPALSTDNIRTNAAVRVGLANARTEEEATAWLSLFGSSARPPAKLESNRIQSLVFGGLSFMPHGAVLLVKLSETGGTAAARAWLREVAPLVAWDDGRRLRRDAVVTLALGAEALRKAGLPSDAMDTFPAAFLEGMSGPGRARILGDGAGDQWWWEREATSDVAILAYAVDQPAADALRETLARGVLAHGHAVERVVRLNKVPSKDEGPPIEPFGFVDGVSQPVIRGTYRGLRGADPIHLMEPGEFILGYPDNRGNVPPGPQMAAVHDPRARLPIRCDGTEGFGAHAVEAPREIGRNGSFLVVRQLEQDVQGFRDYCAAEAERLKDRLGPPYAITPDFLAAKMVGRWRDGSSLARNPYQSLSDSGPLERNPTVRPATKPAAAEPIAAPAVAPLALVPAPAVASPPASPGAAAGSPEVKHDRRASKADNDFLLGAEDPQGLRCPYGAHIRRANPRDSLDPGSQDQIDITNRHRILRVGRSYAPEAGQGEGLLFMCLNGDIERQFEFVQQTWMASETFHGLSGERDPLAGAEPGCPNGFTVPTRDGPVRLSPMSRFVTPRGGGYFFLPGRQLLDFLCAEPPPQAGA